MKFQNSKMHAYDLTMKLKKYLFLTMAYVRELLILPLDMLLLVVTTLLLKIVQDVVVYLVQLLSHSQDVLFGGNDLFLFAWNTASQYIVHSFDYLYIALRCEYICV